MHNREKCRETKACRTSWLPSWKQLYIFCAASRAINKISISLNRGIKYAKTIRTFRRVDCHAVTWHGDSNFFCLRESNNEGMGIIRMRNLISNSLPRTSERCCNLISKSEALSWLCHFSEAPKICSRMAWREMLFYVFYWRSLSSREFNKLKRERKRCKDFPDRRNFFNIKEKWFIHWLIQFKSGNLCLADEHLKFPNESHFYEDFDRAKSSKKYDLDIYCWRDFIKMDKNKEEKERKENCAQWEPFSWKFSIRFIPYQSLPTVCPVILVTEL